MLSAESAAGKFPLESVRMQQKIISSVENDAVRPERGRTSGVGEESARGPAQEGFCGSVNAGGGSKSVVGAVGGGEVEGRKREMTHARGLSRRSCWQAGLSVVQSRAHDGE